MIEIKSRYTGEVIYTHEGDTLVGADLRGANLYGAYLRGADLYGAELRGANLYGANLYGANLRRADLRKTNLRGAELRGANLYGADFTDATVIGHKVTKTPIQINNLKWAILITEQAMQVGCQVHTHDEWEAFSGDELSSMDGGAFEFAEKWRTVLLYMCREHAK